MRMSALPGRPTVSRRAPWRRARYAALDFETTGLDFERDSVVSFGVVPVNDGRAVVGESVHQLVRPEVPPTPRSQTIHELRPQDLRDAPSLAEARETLRGALDGRYLLVWFAEVEINFLVAAFGGRPRAWRRRTIDVRNLAMEVDAQPRSARREFGYGLSFEAERRGVPVANPHEALDDAFVTAQLFLVLVRKLRRPAEPTVADLLRVARADPLVERRFSLVIQRLNPIRPGGER
jgi:DNA polymerase III subunit epsilon